MFSDVENITGGSGADTFNLLAGGSISGQIDGGTGSDTLVAPDTDNAWALSGSNAGKVNATDFIGIENLTGGTANDTFTVAAGASISGNVSGGAFDPAAPTVNTLDYSTRGSPVSVNLETASGTAISAFSNITRVVGSASADTLIGPSALHDQTAWTVTGANAGSVEGTAFAGFENLTGQPTTSDAFVFQSGGSISGTISARQRCRRLRGPRRGSALTAFQPVGTDAAGTATVAGKTINYAGMDHYTPLSGNDTDRTITGTVFDRNLVIEDANPSTPGQMKVSFDNLTFTTGGSTFTFNDPSKSLTLITGTGTDAILVLSTDPGFTGALLRYSDGGLSGALTNGADTCSST